MTATDDVRAAITRYLDVSGSDVDTRHEICHDDAVLEFPQSGERVEGVANFREWRRIYPAGVEFEIRRMHDRGDGAPAWDAPQWRARWRAATPTTEGARS